MTPAGRVSLSALAAVATLGLVPAPRAHATHDVGATWIPVRLAADGRAAVVACDRAAPDKIRLLLVGRRGQLLDELAELDAGEGWCSGPEAADRELRRERPELAARLDGLGADAVPIVSRWSPSKARYVLVGSRVGGADLDRAEGRIVTHRLCPRPGLRRGDDAPGRIRNDTILGSVTRSVGLGEKLATRAVFEAAQLDLPRCLTIR